MNQDRILRRVRVWTCFFIFGLFISGATAIPLRWEVDVLAKLCGIGDAMSADGLSVVGKWLFNVRSALVETGDKFPFLYYGTDWLAFGHFVIAIAFIGALRDPVRNSWLFDFGLIACVLVIPFALVFGAVRGIPFWWRLIDCSFGVFGFIPLWFCRKWVWEIESARKK